ncbi:MAG: phosphoenolpyruvate--protein phosphotransferase [Lachnospiraceae bacterium]|nr:phosphoenolpyruvate--protein phosphotransferase [Lachnospiraceae bacterium]
MAKGVAASQGYGIGQVIIIKEASLDFQRVTISDVEAEKKRLADALDVFMEKTQAMADDMKERIGEKEAEILEGHILMMQDPEMTGQIEGAIENEHINAEAALDQVCDMFIQMFSSIDDEMFQQRATDVADIKTRMLKILLGVEEVDISAVPAGTVLVAVDLTPSMTAGINNQNVVGIMTEVGGKTSHSAILARALEIPAVLSIDGIVGKVKNGQTVIVDGTEGEVILEPSAEEIDAYTAKRAKYLEDKKLLEKFRGKASQMASGEQVELVGNIGNPNDALKVVECDGEGVGLFRTEFLFMDATSIPSEDEQFEAYKEAAKNLDGKPVIIRTLDIGGDKAIPYLGLETEENPFLGYRAVRFCLDRKEDIYKPQLRALLRASAFGNIRIMVPLVTCVEEIRAVKAMVEELKADLDEKGIAYDKEIKVGIMTETAASGVIADLLAKEADFFSIGTNDLTGYTMAVDRGNAKVAYLYSAFQPAVLRSIKRIIECGKKEGIMVGMCGEAAADPMLVPVLLAWGLDEFSVSPTSILATRKVMSQWTMEEAKEVADKVLTFATEEEVVAYLKSVAKA